MQNLERRSDRPFSGKGPGGRLKRVPVKDISGEGPQRNPAVPVDAQELLRTMESIRAGGTLTRTVSMLRADRTGTRTRFRR